MRPARVVGAEPPVVGDVDERIGLARAASPHHTPHHARDSDLEADGHGNAGNASIPQRKRTPHGRISRVEVERHAACAEVEQRLLKPLPIGDVGHRLAEGREEELVDADHRHVTRADDVCAVVVAVPGPAPAVGAKADVRRATDEHRRAEPLREQLTGTARCLAEPLREQLGHPREPVTRPPVALDQEPDRIGLHPKSREHRLGPHHEVDALAARAGRLRRVDRDLHEAHNVALLALPRPPDLVVDRHVRLHCEDHRTGPRRVSGLAASPEPVGSRCRKKRHRHGRACDRTARAAHGCEHDIRDRSRARDGDHRREARAADVGDLRQEARVDERMACVVPGVAVEDHDAAHPLHGDDGCWRRHRKRNARTGTALREPPDKQERQHGPHGHVHAERGIPRDADVDEEPLHPHPAEE